MPLGGRNTTKAPQPSRLYRILSMRVNETSILINLVDSQCRSYLPDSLQLDYMHVLRLLSLCVGVEYLVMCTLVG